MNQEEYREVQLVRHKSHEADNSRWREGQRRFVGAWLTPYLRDRSILDIACGDGCGLEFLRGLEFSKVVGVEWEAGKAERARAHGFPVHVADMHDLSEVFPDDTFDVVYSSHTLEHALHPEKVLREFRRILKPSGDLILVLPYPDPGEDNMDAHCGKVALGTHLKDDAATLIKTLDHAGFDVKDRRYDDFREPEIWLRLFPKP